MWQRDLAIHFDRIARHTWLPIGAALIISATAFGAYSVFTVGADIRAIPTAAQESPPVKVTGVETNDSDDGGASLRRATLEHERK